MVVNRLESAPDILRELKALEREQYSRKERQIVGADAVRVLKVSTVAVWDWNGTLPESDYVNQRDFVVTFMPDNHNAGLNVHTKCEIDGMPGMSPQISVVGLHVSDPKVQRWRVRVRHYGAQVVRVKFYVTATGKGAISVV